MRLLWRGQAPDGLRVCDSVSRPTYQLLAFLLRSRTSRSLASEDLSQSFRLVENNRQATAPWSPVLASKLKEAGIRRCPSYSSRSTPGDQGQGDHGAHVNENLPESARRIIPRNKNFARVGPSSKVVVTPITSTIANLTLKWHRRVLVGHGDWYQHPRAASRRQDIYQVRFVVAYFELGIEQ